MSSEDPNKFVDRLLDAGRGEAPNAGGKSSALAAVERGDAPRAAPPKGTPWTTWAARAVGTAVIVGVAVWAISPRGGDQTQPSITQPSIAQPPNAQPSIAQPPSAQPPNAQPPNDQPPNDQPSNTQPSNTQPPNEQPPNTQPVVQPVVQPAQVEPRVEPVVVAPVKQPKRSARVDAGATDDDTLARELELLETARTSLPSNPSKAVATLESYFKQFPKGSLTQEASLLKIEALVRAGRRGDAEVAAKRFLGASSSPLLQERVRTILESKQ